MASTFSRRRVLASSGSIATAGLAGCVIQEALADCRSDKEPVDSPDSIAYDTGGPLQLSSDPREAAKGEQITFALENIGETQVNTGKKTLFAIEKRADGWKPIYWVENGYGWFMTAPRHDPGPIYRWTFIASQSGFEAPDQPYHICTDVEPGTYRFVYFGMGPENPEADQAEPEAIATRFQILPESE
jgi:hypothetical protein